MSDNLENLFKISYDLGHNMGGLSDKSDIAKCVYHTKEKYINILENLKKAFLSDKSYGLYGSTDEWRIYNLTISGISFDLLKRV